MTLPAFSLVGPSPEAPGPQQHPNRVQAEPRRASAGAAGAAAVVAAVSGGADAGGGGGGSERASTSKLSGLSPACRRAHMTV